MKLNEDLEILFLTRDYQWKKTDGQLFTPDAEDIQAVLDRAVEILDNEEDDAQLEVGRLIFMKRPGLKLVDVFLHIGEINENF